MAIKFEMNQEGLKTISSAISRVSEMVDSANAAVPRGDEPNPDVDVTRIVPALCDLGSYWSMLLNTQDYVTAVNALCSLRTDTEELIKFYGLMLKKLKKNLTLIDKTEAALSESAHNTARYEDA